MAQLPIVTYDDPVLSRTAEPIERLTDELRTLIEDMFETMYEADGVGLAAPQVGRSIRLFVIDADVLLEGEEDDPQALGQRVFINPEIVHMDPETVEMEEGCLSLPGLRDTVSRSRAIRIRYLDHEMAQQELELDGWNARVVLHEYDHLDGVLFTDRLTAFRRAMHTQDLKKIRTGKMHADYPLAPKS